MHIYIYDAFLSQHKYRGVLAKIETRITDLGLNGKIIRLDVMKNVFDVVENELKRGAKTIVAVGNNKTIHQVVNAMLAPGLESYSHVPLGIIPVGKNDNEISQYLGILPEEKAGDVLSARRIEGLDIGRVNDNYFLGYASINSQGTKIEIDEEYSVEILESGMIKIVNFLFDQEIKAQNKKITFNPQDGRLELLIQNDKGKGFFRLRPNTQSASIFYFDEINIINKDKNILLDGVFSLSCPAKIKISSKKINIIVGKNRKF